MSTLASVVFGVAYTLVVITAIKSTYAAWRHREPRHLNIFAAIISLALIPILSGQRAPRWSHALQTGLLLAQPYLSLRLVEHFRSVSRVVLGGSLAIALGGALVVTVGSSEWLAALFTVSFVVDPPDRDLSRDLLLP